MTACYVSSRSPHNSVAAAQVDRTALEKLRADNARDSSGDSPSGPASDDDAASGVGA